MANASGTYRSVKFDATETKAGDAALPGMLRGPGWHLADGTDPLLSGISVARSLSLSGTQRATGGAQAAHVDPTEQELLALETEDGSTLFIRADKLAEDIARLRPEAVHDGEIDFSRFRNPNAASRGIGDVFWKAVSVIKLPDDLLEEARKQAADWARKKLGDAAKDSAFNAGSFLLTKALMWRIEARLAGNPGLYRWQDINISTADRCDEGDARLQAAANGAPMLVLIHGTGSYTQSSFEGLREDPDTWQALQRHFTGGIFGYEHRTFSQSPIENAVELLSMLPKGARVSLLTHSRGGLVGDLLALESVSDSLLLTYKVPSQDSTDAEGLEREMIEERERLTWLIKIRAERGVRIQRYVRVACPARGTRLLSDNLEATLSDFLGLVQWGGGKLVTLAAGVSGGPVAAELAGRGASSVLGVLKRLVLEIAGRRVDPRMVPGIAAMRVDSPLAAMLAHPAARRLGDVEMAVVAGDTEFDGFDLSNLGRRIANLFCDWRLFDRNDNDLVVDTDSMFEGLASRDGARYLYDQDRSVTHFRYFRNPLTRDAARDWLHADDCLKLDKFTPLTTDRAQPRRDLDESRTRGRADPKRPVVVLLPGIMGSHIEARKRQQDAAGSGDRLWFDFFRLAGGALSQLRDTASPLIQAEDIWELHYGALARYLAATHNVIRCPYDWRQPLDAGADTLAVAIEQALAKFPGQPVHLLAHSMGGLVARTLMHGRHHGVWRKVVASGGRLVMLGTPNHGAHLMAHSLLGKSDNLRMLAALDLRRNLQEVINVVAEFRGALQLLPRPEFRDTGDAARIDPAEYYLASTWSDLKARNRDRWYGDHIGALPTADALRRTQEAWRQLPAETVADAERVAYVFGQGDQTPCGIVRTGDGRLQWLFTGDGDGTVTWASGALAELTDKQRCWIMPATHGDLANEPRYFDALTDLLATGSTDRLARLPRRRAAASSTFMLEAGPSVRPNEEELARTLIGAGPPRRISSRRKTLLKVGVAGGDLRFNDQPVLCGHYIGDPISGAEASLDGMLDGRLQVRAHLGVYASDIGTSTIVLRPRSDEERLRGSRPGAVIVGLGDFNGQLAASQITETVRAAVLRYLLMLRDSADLTPGETVKLSSLLVGCGTAKHISVIDSVAAVTRGVLEANRQYLDALGKEAEGCVGELTFVELFRDAAITAARAVQNLPRELERDLRRLGAGIEPRPLLEEITGLRERMEVDDEFGYWSRLIVTDADALDSDDPPECPRADRTRPPAPPASTPAGVALDSAVKSSTGGTADTNAPGCDHARDSHATPAEGRRYPERLKYVYLSPRARAESVLKQTQPGVIEALVAAQRRNQGYDPSLGSTLFHLLLPLDYKLAARQQSRILLVLDAYTAAYPWELMRADGEPLVLRLPMVRQLATTRYRPAPRSAGTNSACIIVSPSTEGFNKRFGGRLTSLDRLEAATAEGDAIETALQGWDVNHLREGKAAVDVYAALYARPYRVLAIAAHGIFEAPGTDGRKYTGVVLSDGLLLGANEITQLETVPELVFLSACHVGSITRALRDPGRLAHSLARELIDAGVRCVVAAGWEVNDDAASLFSSTFFNRMAAGDTFSDALLAARRLTYDQFPETNTWGAYQAYGHPDYRLTAPGQQTSEDERPWVSPAELVAALRARTVSNRQPGLRAAGKDGKRFDDTRRWAERQLSRGPQAWARRGDVLEALAELQADLGTEGFVSARALYLQALRAENGVVPVHAVAKVANLEARQGHRMALAGDLKGGSALIDSAIMRLAALDGLGANTDPPSAHAKRAGILGSALKRRAEVLALQGRKWPTVSKALAAAADAYEKGVRGEAWQHPYLTINALPLRALSGSLSLPTEQAIELARRCADEARRILATERKDFFWNAVMSADCRMIAWLLKPDAETGASQLKAAYDEALRGIPESMRQWDSVVTQIALLARLLERRGENGDESRAMVLVELVRLLDTGRISLA